MDSTTPASQLLRSFLETASDKRIATSNYSGYGIDDDALLLCFSATAKRMIAQDMDHSPGVDTIPSVAKKIGSSVDEYLRSNYPNATPSLQERIKMEAIYDWVRTHVLYNTYLIPTSIGREVRKKHWTPEELIKMDSPNGVCAGFANTVVAMGKVLGLNCYAVYGSVKSTRSNKLLPSDELKAVDHKWVCLRQSDGLIVPLDASSGRVSLEYARSMKGEIRDPITSPVTREDWAFYLATYRANALSSTGRVLPKEMNVTTLSYDQWKQVDLSPLRQYYSSVRADRKQTQSGLVNRPVR